MDSVRDFFRASQQAASPLILDLDGDGIEISQLTGAITFDHNADGIRTGTAWAGADDGLLVFDRNANGLIDSGRELFGNNTVLATGQKAADGYAALRELDQNASGAIDTADAAFAHLRVWRDLDQDGSTDAGELRSLQDAGITQIGLSKTAFSETLADGTRLDGEGSFVVNGEMRSYTDAWLAEDPFHRRFTTPIELSEEVSALPGMRGSGAVRDLHEAAMLSEPLRLLLEQFQAAGTRDAQRALVDPILQAWTDTSDFLTTAEWEARGHRVQFVFSSLDAVGTEQWIKRLTMLEAFNAQNYAPLSTGNTRVQTGLNAQSALEQSYLALFESVYVALTFQTRIRSYFDAVKLVIDDTGIRLDTSGIDVLLQQRAQQHSADAVADLLDLRALRSPALQEADWNPQQTLSGILTAVALTPELTKLLASAKLAWIDGVLRDDFTAVGDNLDNIIEGELGISNSFYGGRGNDSLNGGYRADQYLFHRGDGSDTINEYWSYTDEDTIRFGAGIAAADIQAQRMGEDLVLTVAGQAGDQISLHRWYESFLSNDPGACTLQLSDGRTLNFEELARRAMADSNRSSDGADKLRGFLAQVDRLVGGEGHDTLTAVGPNDILEGGAGDDVLNAEAHVTRQVTFVGGTGNDRITSSGNFDTFIYQRGDGSDILEGWWKQAQLRFGPGISMEQLAARRDGGDLVLSFGGSADDRIVVRAWFINQGWTYNHQSVSLGFDDGGQMDGLQLSELALTTSNTGTPGDDVLTGTASYADRLLGGDGNDQLTGVGYDDVLDGGAGNDVLRASNASALTGGAGDDTITGSFYRDTYFYRRGDGSDTITDWGAPTQSQDVLNFADGILPQHVSARRVDQDLLLSIDGQPGDSITVKNWFFNTEGNNRIEEMRFADGTLWLANDVTQRALATTNRGGVGGDVLLGWALQAETLEGGEGNDTLTAAGNGDVLDGGAGDDLLRATAASDGYSSVEGTTYIGGKGSDTIQGSSRDDLYLYQRGDGSDTIKDVSGRSHLRDELRFGPGISSADLRACRSGSDLIIDIAGGPAGDRITIQSWFNSVAASTHIARFCFTDGSVWTSQTMSQLALVTSNQGSDGDDQLMGTLHHAERLVGGQGSDTLVARGDGDVLDAGAGDDVLSTETRNERGTVFIGGAGNDTLKGSHVGDTYHYGRGDGADILIEEAVWTNLPEEDTLHFGAGIAVADIDARRSGDDLLLTVAGQTGDSILVQGWFVENGPPNRGLEHVVFADGQRLTKQHISQLALAHDNMGTAGPDTLTGSEAYADRLLGGAGNDQLNAAGTGDVLEGGEGDDTLSANAWVARDTTFIGGPGNDRLTGSYYADTFVFGRGDGSDTLSATAYWGDELHFGPGIGIADIAARRDGNHLVLSVAGQAGDRIQIPNWFLATRSAEELGTVRFADGGVVAGEFFTQLALRTSSMGTAGPDSLSGVTAYAEHLRGGDGNDTLTGAGAGDVLDGGAGDDVLKAGSATGGMSFIGGTGNDTLTGSSRDDVYRFERGDGADTLNDNGQASANTDRLEFGAGILEQDLWFSRWSGNHLRINVLGNGGQIQVNNWFTHDKHQLEELRLSDGQALLARQVNVLVEAMAAFAPPPMGQTSLTPQQQATLAPLIAASWN